LTGRSSTPRLIGFITDASGILDRPLEPVIGRRGAPTRWRAMTAGNMGAFVVIVANTNTRVRDPAARARVLLFTFAF
jgi:hypothetical protein